MSFGFHLSKENAIEHMRSYSKEGFKCFQCFVSSPMKGEPYKFTELEREIAAELTTHGIHIYVHASYITYPWNSKSFSIHQIKNEMLLASSISARGYVIHLPQYEKLLTYDCKSVNDKCLVIMDNIRKYIPEGLKVLFEIQASSSNTNERLDVVVPVLKDKGFGLVVDTAHCWSSGIDVSTIDKFKFWFQPNIEEITEMVHFNDSEIKLAGRKDVHAIPGHGKIWSTMGEYIPIIKYLRSLNIDVIFEAVPLDEELQKILNALE
jgi:endonuclease IV